LSTSVPSVQRRGGLANVVDIFVAPNAAFDRLREVPTWLWAFLIATVLGAVGSLIAQPAVLHALNTSMPAQLAADPNTARLSPDQQQKQIALVMGAVRVFARLGWILTPFYILVVGLIQALALLVANAIGKGRGSFSKFFALSVTVSIIGTGLYYLMMGIIVVIRGADSFDSPTAVQSAVPSLALLVPGSHGALPAFLGVLNVFYLWSVALLALGAVRIGRMAPAAAWAAPIVLLLCWALFTAYGARNGG
jgi:membrane protein, antimicrobial resistance system